MPKLPLVIEKDSDAPAEGTTAEDWFNAEVAAKELAVSQEKLASLQDEIAEKQKEIAANIEPVRNATLAECVKQFQDAAKKSIEQKAKTGQMGKRK